ncbi:Lachesin [Acromyrmex echinatior]|uniref:Lachesin n=1 Tax=Acromyrmex echinatior TaxID=103372 RepID=F4X406_ACREC|nr:Lachesin [Acromyrmex echinatior]
MTVRNSALSSSKLRANGAIYYIEAFLVEKYIERGQESLKIDDAEALRKGKVNDNVLIALVKQLLAYRASQDVQRSTLVAGLRTSKARACLRNKDPKHYGQPRSVPSHLTLRRNVLHFKKVSDILCVIRRQAFPVASRLSRSEGTEQRREKGRETREAEKSDPSLEIRIPPMLWIPHQLVGAPLGYSVILECYTEAHPTSLNYWAREDGLMIHESSKYKTVSLPDKPSYKTHMMLTINDIQSNLLAPVYFQREDYGSYKCIAKNPRGETDGTIRLYSKCLVLPACAPSHPFSTVYQGNDGSSRAVWRVYVVLSFPGCLRSRRRRSVLNELRNFYGTPVDGYRGFFGQRAFKIDCDHPIVPSTSRRMRIRGKSQTRKEFEFLGASPKRKRRNNFEKVPRRLGGDARRSRGEKQTNLLRLTEGNEWKQEERREKKDTLLRGDHPAFVVDGSTPVMPLRLFVFPSFVGTPCDSSNPRSISMLTDQQISPRKLPNFSSLRQESRFRKSFLKRPVTCIAAKLPSRSFNGTSFQLPVTLATAKVSKRKMKRQDGKRAASIGVEQFDEWKCIYLRTVMRLKREI